MRFYLLAIGLFFTLPLKAFLKIPSIISSHMVLQQQKSNRIWGKAAAGQKVSVSFNGKNYFSYADETGNWQVYLDAGKAGKAGDMEIKTDDAQVLITDILFGEVWICSGQSNMEWSMGLSPDVNKEEIKNADNDDIRFVVIDKTVANLPKNDVNLYKAWSPINASTISDCSSVAYWYAKQLNKELHIPVGLIVSSWGGTYAQSWLGYEGLDDFPHYQKIYDEKIANLDMSTINEKRQEQFQSYLKELQNQWQLMQDVVSNDYNDNDWIDMHLPGEWEEQGYPSLDGVGVYRLKFNLPKMGSMQSPVLNMPAIDDMDSTYINGKLVGTVNQWDALRTYKIPAGLLQEGVNVLVIKVTDGGGGGGLGNQEDKFNITVGKQVYPLAGKAKFKIVAAMKDLTDGNGVIEHQPTVLFNGMIAPLLPVSFRGVIWYQGESNADQPVEYRTLFPALIRNWRNRFGQGDFPFLFVQLASFGPLSNKPVESNWAMLREAQAGALNLDNTAMAVAIDIGDPENIHPSKKKEVGERLAANALKLVYRLKNSIDCNPMFDRAAIKGNKIIITIKNTGGLLKTKDGALKGFAIAGMNKKFVWANAVIKGNSIIVSSKEITEPKFVRYAWADSPIEANLYNNYGFTVPPFRTDKD